MLCGLGSPLNAADQKGGRGERLKAITGDVEQKYTAYMQAFDNAKTDAERSLAEKKKPSDAEFGKRLLAFVKEAPGDAVSFDALTWVFENLDSADSAAQRDEAVELFEKNHLKSQRLKIALPKLAACVDSIDAGVSAAHILDGREPHSLLLELFTDEGIGTMIEATT